MNSIGDILLRARKKQGRSIIQVEEATKIPTKYIKALETDQFHLIPGDVYVKGFLHTYASYLGLDSSRLVEEYKRIQKPPPSKKEIEATFLTSVAKRRSRKKWVALGMTVVIVGFLVGLLWLGSIKEKPTKVLGGKAKQEKVLPEKKPAPEPSSEDQSSSVSTPVVTVKLKAIGRYGCWMRVDVDDSEVFKGTLQPGQEKEWSANQSIFIRATNPRGLQVTKNGQDLGVFAESNRVAERTFTAE